MAKGKGPGRPFKFNPKQFELAWQQYFQWVDDNPWYKSEAVKSGDLAGTIIKVPTARPYSEIGFCAFHDLGEKYLTNLSKNLDDKALDGVSEEEHDQLKGVLTQARARCYAQKFEGAAVGAFNANIIARDLGLADKKETKHTLKIGKDAEEEIYE
ncbi:terminase small subunit [Pedobacter sp. AW1-32]|uniref:terminase small subunit n=1 Tax=Pedobacter sp. AW1-32 TaxID=3383026 RepID=UPI003FEE89B0